MEVYNFGNATPVSRILVFGLTAISQSISESSKSLTRAPIKGTIGNTI